MQTIIRNSWKRLENLSQCRDTYIHSEVVLLTRLIFESRAVCKLTQENSTPLAPTQSGITLVPITSAVPQPRMQCRQLCKAHHTLLSNLPTEVIITFISDLPSSLVSTRYSPNMSSSSTVHLRPSYAPHNHCFTLPVQTHHSPQRRSFCHLLLLQLERQWPAPTSKEQTLVCPHVRKNARWNEALLP